MHLGSKLNILAPFTTRLRSRSLAEMETGISFTTTNLPFLQNKDKLKFPLWVQVIVRSLVSVLVGLFCWVVNAQTHLERELELSLELDNKS